MRKAKKEEDVPLLRLHPLPISWQAAIPTDRSNGRIPPLALLKRGFWQQEHLLLFICTPRNDVEQTQGTTPNCHFD